MKRSTRLSILMLFWATMAGGLAGISCGGIGGCPDGQVPGSNFKFGIAAEEGCVFTCIGSGDCPSDQFCESNFGNDFTISGTCESCSSDNFPEGTSFECDSDEDCGDGGECVGCQCSGGSTTCQPELNIAGTWTSDFQCIGTECINGTDTLEVIQNGNSVSYRDEAESFTANGTFCGNTFTWTGTTDPDVTPGFDESGTWTLTDANHFTKVSDFTRKDSSGGGHCEGSGAKPPEVPTAAPLCP